MIPFAVRTAFYNLLNVTGVTSQLSTAYGVPAIFWEQAPQVSDPSSDAGFPYITCLQVGDPGFSTKDAVGTSALIQVDVWSRLQTGECEAVAQACFTALDRADIVATLPSFVRLDCEGMAFSRDPDGITRRALMTFRLVALP